MVGGCCTRALHTMHEIIFEYMCIHKKTGIFYLLLGISTHHSLSPSIKPYRVDELLYESNPPSPPDVPDSSPDCPLPRNLYFACRIAVNLPLASSN